MQLNEIFAKDVQRPIEGVIKADDAAHLKTEVDEYVLTNEAAKGLELLLESYTNYTTGNGVWISGFFGSGKSHLLKMLAHLLGAGDVVLPYFLDKCSEKKICIPKILFGAGLTYPSSIALGHLDQFDSVFLRNLSDLRDVEKRLTVEQTHYVPDLVFALDGVVPQKYHSMRPRAGFYLIQSIDEQNPDNKDRHKRVLRQVAQCIEFVAETHDVVLIRFDTSGKRDSDDKTVCKKMMDMCKSLVDAGILQYDEKQELRTPEDMMKFMSTCQVNICMRFHAHVFSIIQNIPFVSLSLTRKVRLLMNETGLANDCGVVVKEDQKTLRAVDVPVEEFKQKFKNVVAKNHRSHR